MIADQTTQPINLTPNQFTLSDVTLYTNTSTDLFTVNPLTGAYETDVTNTGNNTLPGSPEHHLRRHCHAPDGELYSFTSRTGNGSETVAGHYVRFDTGDAKTLLSDSSDQIRSFQADPNNPVNTVPAEQTNVGFNVNAMAYGPLVQNTNWPLFVVGNRAAGGTDLSTNTANLLYKLDPNTGAAYDYPNSPTVDRVNSNKVPLAELYSARRSPLPPPRTSSRYPPRLFGTSWTAPRSRLPTQRLWFRRPSSSTADRVSLCPSTRRDSWALKPLSRRRSRSTTARPRRLTEFLSRR